MTKGFPEDQYTGAYSNVDEGDPNDAASFGAHNYSALPTAALTEGCTFTVDYTNNVVDIASGSVRLVAQNLSGANSTTWNNSVLFYELSSATGLALTDGDINHVYVEADLSSVDTANFVINTTGSAPSGPSHKLGEIDTTASQTKSEQWGLTTANGTLTYPSEAAAMTAAGSLPDGTIVYDRSTNTQYSVNGSLLDTTAFQTWVTNNFVDEGGDAMSGDLQIVSISDSSGNSIAQNVVASGQVTLSNSSGVVDTGLSTTDATFNLALGLDDPNADCKISGRLFWDDSAGTYKVEVKESGTAIGNPTVNYDIVRVR